jgi:hypothetical protein
MIDMQIRENIEKPLKVRRSEARKQNGGLSKLSSRIILVPQIFIHRWLHTFV